MSSTAHARIAFVLSGGAALGAAQVGMLLALAEEGIEPDLITGTDIRLDSSPELEAVLASASIPGLFPPVVTAGQVLMDGGVVNNTPISHAVELGATTVWVLSTGYACALEEPPRGALAMALHALTLTINQRLAVDVERYESTVDLRVVPPLCPIRTTPADFGHSTELIERAHRTTSAWLARGGTTPGSQVGLLEPHDHAILPVDEAGAPTRR